MWLTSFIVRARQVAGNKLMQKPIAGFTLIELMIVVAIVGILAAIAYPSYTDSVRKGRRAEAITALYQLQLAEEKWRANNAAYTSTLSDLGIAATVPASGTAYYDIAIAAGANGTSFSATATAKSTGGQNQDKASGVLCTPLTINQSGPDYGSPSKAACWGKS